MKIKNIHKVLLAALVLLLPAVMSAIPERPQPQRLVNDFAGLFTADQAAVLEHNLVAFDDTTSNQITIVTVTDLEGYDPSEYATRIGLDWGVGSAEFDNGIVMLIKPKTNTSGKVFIAVGYGLEGAIPDAYAKRIVNEILIPHFMENDYFGGVESACRELMGLAGGEISVLRRYEEEDNTVQIIVSFFFLFILFMILGVIASKNNKGGGNGGNGGRRIYTGPIITTGGGFGGWGSSGGSFGGGFGGFGGFGGGSFGGGGAGGSW